MIKYEDLDLLTRFGKECFDDDAASVIYPMLELYSYRNFLTERLTKALEQELQDAAQDIRENWEYIDREETQTVMVREWRHKE